MGDLLTGKLLTFDALKMEFHTIKLPKADHKWAICGDHPTITELIDYEQDVYKRQCYRCVFKNPPPKDAVPTCKQAGVIGAMGGVIGSDVYKRQFEYRCFFHWQNYRFHWKMNFADS